MVEMKEGREGVWDPFSSPLPPPLLLPFGDVGWMV